MKTDHLKEIDFGACAVQNMNSTASPKGGPLVCSVDSVIGDASTQTGNERASAPAGPVVSPTPAKREFVVIADAPPLAGAKAPFHLNQKERPRHRVMLELAAKGYDNKEIAANLGVSAVNVNNALRQPHSQQTLANLCRDRVSADEQVVQVIRENVVKAVNTLAEIMEDDDARNSDRIAAAEALLNRRYGKPNQPINSGSTVDLNHLSDEALAKMLPTETQTTTS